MSRKLPPLPETSRTITVTIKDDFDPYLGADVIEAVDDFITNLSMLTEK